MENVPVCEVEILPTSIWIESGMLGDRWVCVQHQGCHAFTFAHFGYDYLYTSNSGTYEAARALALSLGATEPIEHRQRPLPPMPTTDELRKQIQLLQKYLAELEAGACPGPVPTDHINAEKAP